MSVSRKFDEGPPSESFGDPEKRQMHASLDQGAEGRKRMAVPKNELLDPTLKWAASLPRNVQPLALMRQFPRLANQLAASWSDTPSVRLCLEGLLVDHRGGRQGFPPDVLRELLSLELYYEIGAMITVPPIEAPSDGEGEAETGAS
jgi:hypothetical protein